MCLIMSKRPVVPAPFRVMSKSTQDPESLNSFPIAFLVLLGAAPLAWDAVGILHTLPLAATQLTPPP
jgi:hypothetical protein